MLIYCRNLEEYGGAHNGLCDHCGENAENEFHTDLLANC